MDIDADIDLIMDTFGINATLGAIPGKVILDTPSTFANGYVNDIAVNKYSAMMKASQWPDLKDRDVITIGTKSYIIHSIKYIDDGYIKVADLK